MNKILKKKIIYLLLISISFLSLSGCAKYKAQTDPNRPLTAKEKREKNIEEGRGASLGTLLGNNDRGTTYQFSTSNPMWRASLETLDFLPLTTVDYSGGVIITDWYAENNNNKEAIKITLRFLSNEIRSDSVKIILHKRNCTADLRCTTNLVKSSLIKDELRSTILRKASLFEKADKEKK